jgi:hypothetical protein
VLGGLTIAFVAAAIVWAIVSASALSQTFDEPHHLATGIEWWQFGTYRWWTENPPLPKVVTGLAPYLAGVRLPGPTATLPNPWAVGIDLLDGGGARILMLARVGTLLFLSLTLWQRDRDVSPGTLCGGDQDDYERARAKGGGCPAPAAAVGPFNAPPKGSLASRDSARRAHGSP